MKNKIAITFLILSFFLHNSCKKESSETETVSQPVYPTISGYTSTDQSGNLLGPIDSTDWRTDDIWSTDVQTLFGGSANSNCVFEDTSMFVSAFPNPTTDISNVAIGPIDFSTGEFIDTSTVFEMIVVNQRHEIIVSKTQMKNMLTFSLAAADSLASDTIFRVYYKFTDKNNCVRCGHGDILRN